MNFQFGLFCSAGVLLVIISSELGFDFIFLLFLHNKGLTKELEEKTVDYCSICAFAWFLYTANITLSDRSDVYNTMYFRICFLNLRINHTSVSHWSSLCI